MHSMRAAVHVATKHSVLGNLMCHGFVLKESALPAPQLCIRQNSACARKAVERQLGFHHDAGHLHYPSSLSWLCCHIALGPYMAEVHTVQALSTADCHGKSASVWLFSGTRVTATTALLGAMHLCSAPLAKQVKLQCMESICSGRTAAEGTGLAA